LHWAGDAYGPAVQRRLKGALLAAYFTEGRDVSDPAVLVQIAAAAGLPEAEARELLASDRYDAEVQADEAAIQAQGIRAVPAIIVDQRHLIQGGQTVEVFEQALRQLMGAPA
jgi:predicted DsbA family dithiol-disulfide isomerase